MHSVDCTHEEMLGAETLTRYGEQLEQALRLGPVEELASVDSTGRRLRRVR